MAKPKVAPQMKEEGKSPRKSSCTCVQTFQDQVYGKGIRLWNKTKGVGEYRCTGCGTTRVLLK
jgi:hypothetical protein